MPRRHRTKLSGTVWIGPDCLGPSERPSFCPTDLSRGVLEPVNYWCSDVTCNHQKSNHNIKKQEEISKPLLQHNSRNNLIFVPWLQSVEAVYVDGSQEGNMFLSSK